MSFEKLRDMDTFTDAMFNRIVAFQERKHPAWDQSLPFDERIRDLPLHYLIFSNADRDPARYRQTVAPYYPLSDEIRRIAGYVRLVADAAVVADMHGGNGFIGSLIGREGAKVIGVRDPSAKPNQIEDFYDPACYAVRQTTIAGIDFAFDVAFSSWMPAGVNQTPDIVKHRPKLIVFVFTDHVDNDGKPQTGVPAAFTHLPEQYRMIEEWSITRPRNILHDIWPDLTPSLEEIRHTRIYADAPYHAICLPDEQSPGGSYDWESELEMALLALQAKHSLRATGLAS